MARPSWGSCLPPRSFLLAVVLGLVPMPSAARVPQFPATAPVALMLDMGSGRVLMARGEKRPFLPASTTKIMTAFVAFELIDAGKLDEARVVRVPAKTAAAWSGKGTSMHLRAGEEVTVADLLHGIVTASANDASVVLAEAIAGSVPAFTEQMNSKARELGLLQSRFATPSGWPDGGRTVVSAADLATLSVALIERHPGLYRRYFGHPAMEWRGVTLTNRNPLYGVTTGADGVKTGHTNEAGYNFVGSVERDGRRVVMVLGGLPSEAMRRDEARAFIEWAFAEWETHRLFSSGAAVGSARVQGGTERTLAVMAPRGLFLTLPKGERPVYSLAMRYSGPLSAPLVRGQRVGSLVVRAEGAEPVELPLVAAADVPAGGPLHRLRDGLFGLVGL